MFVIKLGDKMAKKEVKRCSGSMVVGKVLALAGIYVLTWGLIGSAVVGDVLRSPIFWGLILLGVAKCAIHKAHMGMCKA